MFAVLRIDYQPFYQIALGNKFVFQFTGVMVGKIKLIIKKFIARIDGIGVSCKHISFMVILIPKLKWANIFG